MPYVKSGILSALFPYEKVMHICKVEKSGSCEGVILQNSRSQALKEGFLWSLPTQRCLCCVQWGLTACGAGPIDSMCRCLVWNKSRFALDVPGIPVACLMSLFIFAFLSCIHCAKSSQTLLISTKKNFPYQSRNSIMTTLTMVDNLHTLFPCPFTALVSLKLRFSESFVKSH